MHDLVITNRFRDFQYGTLIFFDTESYKYDFSEKWKGIIKLNKYNNIKEIQKMSNYVLLDSSDMTYYYGRTYKKLIADLKYLYEKHDRITVMAHNYKYDIVLSGLMDYIFKKKNIFDLPLTKLIFENIFYAEFKYKSHHKPYKEFFVKFLDTTNFFKQSLRELADNIGLKKYADKEYNYTGNEWNNYIHKNGIKLCILDVFILYMVWHKFTDNEYFIPSLSVSQLAYKVYRKNYLPMPVELPYYCIEPALLSYRGGNTTLYKQIIEPEIYNNYSEFKKPEYLNVYDINSLYPSVMRNHKYSVRLIENEKIINDIEIYNNIKIEKYNYLLNVDYVNLGNNPNPVLFSHSRLLALKENYGQWITGREFMYLIDNGFFVKINKSFKFENAYLFKDYVDFFYKKKSNSKGMEKLFYKHMLNDLYGKLGQNKARGKIISSLDDFKNYIDFDFNDGLFNQFIELLNESNENMFYTDLSGKEFYISKFNGFYKIADNSFEQKLKSVTNNPLIASEITANARLLNYDYRKLIGFDKCYYTDTDSFFTPDTLPENYISDNELGLCKLDKTGYFYLNTEKDYKYYDKFALKPEHVVLKGISRKDKEVEHNKFIHLTFNSYNSHMSQSGYVILSEIEKVRKIKAIKINPITKTEWENINEIDNFLKNGLSKIELPDYAENNFINV